MSLEVSSENKIDTQSDKTADPEKDFRFYVQYLKYLGNICNVWLFHIYAILIVLLYII